MAVRIHPTADIERDVTIGDGTSIWDHAHIRHGTKIGRDCIIGGKTTIAYDVVIGNLCKINSNVYICTAVTIEDGVMISAGTIFTNDRFPRAAEADLSRLRSSDPDDATEKTLVRCGATVGAGSIIGSNLTIGTWAMIGMGSVVTKSVPDFHLAIGSPVRSIGAVCRCGLVICMFQDDAVQEESLRCNACNRTFRREGREITETDANRS
ncbi:MAG: acyltransferase [Pirellulales bacterium]